MQTIPCTWVLHNQQRPSCYSPLPSYQRIVSRGRWWWPHVSDGGWVMGETTLTTLTEIYMSTTPTKGCELWMPDSSDTIISPVMACTIIVKTISITLIFFPMDQTTYNFPKPNLNVNIYFVFPCHFEGWKWHKKVKYNIKGLGRIKIWEFSAF